MGSKYDISKPVELSARARSRMRTVRPGSSPEKGGRAPKPINEDKLRTMAGMGLTQRECAVLLDCNVETIRTGHAIAYEAGKAQFSASIRRKQFEMAMKGNPTMLVWLGKNACGQKDRIEATGKDGGPLYQPVDREAIIERLIRGVESRGQTIQ